MEQLAVPADVLDDRQIPRDAIERTRVHEQKNRRRVDIVNQDWKSWKRNPPVRS